MLEFSLDGNRPYLIIESRDGTAYQTLWEREMCYALRHCNFRLRQLRTLHGMDPKKYAFPTELRVWEVCDKALRLMGEFIYDPTGNKILVQTNFWV